MTIQELIDQNDEQITRVTNAIRAEMLCYTDEEFRAILRKASLLKSLQDAKKDLVKAAETEGMDTEWD